MTAPTLEAVPPPSALGASSASTWTPASRSASCATQRGQIALDVLRHRSVHARPSELPSASPSPRGPSRPSRASSGTRSGSAAVGYGSGWRRESSPHRAATASPTGTPTFARATACACSESCAGCPPPTQASILSAIAPPSSANEGVDGGSTPCSGTTRGSRRQGLRAHGRGRWSLWTRYSGRLASGCPGAVPAYARLRSTSISHGIGWYRGRGGALASPPSRPAGRVSLVFSLRNPSSAASLST